MSKYIIRNCPSCRYTPKRYIDGIDYICWNAQNFNSSVRGVCQDCTDCVMKQIVEKCKMVIEKNYKEEDMHLFSEDDLKILDRIWFDVGMGCKKIAEQILQLLDIQEIE